MAKQMKTTNFGLMMHGAHALAGRALNHTPIKVNPSTVGFPKAEPAPRELTDAEVGTMWAKHPGVSFADFFEGQ